MRQLGLAGAVRGKAPARRSPTRAAVRAPDLVEPAVHRRPAQPALGRRPHLRGHLSGLVYVAFVIDVYSRRIVGWRAATACAPIWRSTRWRWPSGGATAASSTGSSATPTRRRKADSTGRRNTSIVEVCDGDDARAAAGGSVVSGADPVAGAADGGVAGGPGPVLGGDRSRGARPRTRRWRSACHPPVGFRWFRHAGGVNPCLAPTVSGRYLSFAEREDIAHLARAEAAACARSPGGWAGRRRRSRGSCAATRRRGRGGWSTGRRSRSGTPNAGRGGPRSRSWSPTSGCATTCRTGWPASIRAPDGRAGAGPADAPWKGRNKPHRQDRRWATAWSPEQIANRLPVDFPDDESMRISHEAIYQALYVQSRGALKRELVACLRTGRALRVPRARARQQRVGARHPRGDDQRTARRGRRPGGAGPLGRRPASSGWTAPRSARWSSARRGSRCWCTCRAGRLRRRSRGQERPGAGRLRRGCTMTDALAVDDRRRCPSSCADR